MMGTALLFYHPVLHCLLSFTHIYYKTARCLFGRSAQLTEMCPGDALG